MRRRLLGIVLAAAGSFAAGCGDGQVRVTGRLVKAGGPFLIDPDEDIYVTLVPTAGGVTPHYYGSYRRADGTFRVEGRGGKGLPPGPYRLAVRVVGKKHPVDPKFDEARSPFVYEIGTAASDLVVDLDNPPKK